MRKLSTSGKSSDNSTNTSNNQPANPSVSKFPIKPNRAKSYETVATILVNLLLSTAAIAGLIKLIPDQSVQVSKLSALEQEVTAREKTVNCLRDNFSQSFDLGTSQAASLREKGLISATQRPIRFSNDDNSPKISNPKSCN